MHSAWCKCMECARQRFQKAEELAEIRKPDLYYDLRREEAQLKVELEKAQERLKRVESTKRDLVMSYYNEANYGKA
jgi:uncharacterized membrane protein